MDSSSKTAKSSKKDKAPRKKRIGTCFVPNCSSSSIKSPDKIFLCVPREPKIREKWMKAAKQQYFYSPKSILRCCEDHFDMEHDVENWMMYKLVGGKLRLKKDVVPHIFDCQHRMKRSKPRTVVLKCKRQEIIQTIENYLDTEPASSYSQETVEAQQSSEEEMVVKVKQEIEDSFSAHEDEISEYMPNRKRLNPTDPLIISPKIVKIEGPPEVLTVEVEENRPLEALTVEIERERDVFNTNKVTPFPVDFMKTVLSSQNEILTILKSQVLLQDPDADLMKFLRLLGAKLQRLDPTKRKGVQNAILELFN